MSKKITSVPGLFGSTIHYDEHGNVVGESWKGLLGTNHYDEHGDFRGSSMRGLFSDSIHYDEDGNYSGESYAGLFGNRTHYDESGNYVGDSYDTLLGSQTTLYDDSSMPFEDPYDLDDSDSADDSFDDF